MVFSSMIFIFLFLPAVIFTYFVCPAKFLFVRNLILLFFSLAFYFYGEPKYIIIMIFSITINYFFGLLINKAQEEDMTGKKWLVLSVVINLMILVYFKYLSFITENVNYLFNTDIQFQNIVMPIGISFFTFQAMSYVFDVYNKTVPVQKKITNIALYISMFPQLIAGPVVQYSTVASEMNSRKISVDDFAQGITRFIYGLGKKILIANSMAIVADTVFNTSVDALTSGEVWIGIIAYSFQIYYDFSGYSDMAIGLGKIFGFKFLENFNYPYISKSITEFWRRWHISLGTWFRNYVYIPLGGNRVSWLRHVFNIFFVWFLTGFWHGASWNFIVWGLYFAAILTFEKRFILKHIDKIWQPLTHIYSILLIIIGWVIFRSDNLSYAIRYIIKMFNPFSLPLSLSSTNGQAFYMLLEYKFEFIAAIIFSVPIGKLISKLIRNDHNPIFYTFRALYVFAIFTLSIIFLINSTFNPFIYFRF